ncbi:MAG: DUF3168 domain-containing protein [Rhizobiaceae bacterium]|nr:MAG: DUF3168 domain-containing protein [Rhizobiaceae bacterium]
MSAMTFFRDLLLADQSVAAVISNRLWPLELPENGTLPAIVLTPVDESDDFHLGGQNRYPLARVVVDCIADSFPAADSLGDTVKDALVSFRGTSGIYRIDLIAADDVYPCGEGRLAG